MFRRIIWEEIMQDVQVFGLFLLGLCLIYLAARVFTTPREEIDRMANLPLSDD